jgi:hypothetical protein
MSRVVRPITVRSVALGLALTGLMMCASTAAQAGDLAPPVYGPAPYPAAPYPAAPYPAPNYGAGYGGGPCHIVLDRAVDPYGREIVRRVRVCDEGGIYPPVEAPVVGPGYGYPAPRYYGPQPSGYYAYPPRPPAPVGPGYYDNYN